jgi:3-hydroxyisobutyrate dehydrogenase-like beta-hydroxyacid dehydrogenase
MRDSGLLETQLNTPLRIGLVGVGLMGHGIAYNLLKKGHDLTVLEHAGNQPLDELLALGVKTVKTPKALAGPCQLIFIVVTGAPQVQSVIESTDGLLQGLQPGTVVVDCSTSLPDTSLRMAQILQSRGAHFLDAPMTRLAKDAREGRLNLLVGGEFAVLERIRTVLSTFAENITHVGRVGDGHRMKLLHNFVSVGSMTLIAEAAALARSSGMDMTAFERVLATGGGAGIALQRLTPAMLEARSDAVPFTFANAHKDLSYYVDMAKASGAHDAVAQSIVSTLGEQVQAGHGSLYVSALIDQLSQNSKPQK